MKTKAPNRRTKAHPTKVDRLVGRCEPALKTKVGRALNYGLDESNLVRCASDFAVDALESGKLEYKNGRLELARPTPAPETLAASALPGGSR